MPIDLAQQPDATAVQLMAIDPAGATFTAEVAEGNQVAVLVPWSEQITERAQFRSEFARMFQTSSRRRASDRSDLVSNGPPDGGYL
jgi:hypothetical protein